MSATPRCHWCGHAVTVRTSFGWRCCGCHAEWEWNPDTLSQDELLFVYGIEICRQLKIDASFENMMQRLGINEALTNQVGRRLVMRGWVRMRSDMENDRVFIPTSKLCQRMQWAA